MSATKARAIAGEAAAAFADAFGDRLIGAYVLGSLAYGGYSPAVSDIDVALVLASVHDGDTELVASTVSSLHERSPAHRKLSVFWSSLPALRTDRSDGRFPAIDRVQLADYGRLLAGTDVTGEIARTSARDLLLESARFAITKLANDDVVAEFREPGQLLVDKVMFTKSVFFPLRFLRTAHAGSGRSSNNDEAIAWYLSREDAPFAGLVRLAARVRFGEPLDPSSASALLGSDLRPLYLEYLDDHLGRLHAAAAPADLLDAFEKWRTRLAAGCGPA